LEANKPEEPDLEKLRPLIFVDFLQVKEQVLEIFFVELQI
jgi:hypothetical protein